MVIKMAKRRSEGDVVEEGGYPQGGQGARAGTGRICLLASGREGLAGEIEGDPGGPELQQCQINNEHFSVSLCPNRLLFGNVLFI